VINAILNALRPLGVKDIEMPATPHKVWQAIHAAR
jgi:carbon-monoxide dehydrogenase large subunit